MFVRYLPPKHKMMPRSHTYLLSVFICTIRVIKYQCIPQQHAKHCETNNTNAFPLNTSLQDTKQDAKLVDGCVLDF